MGRPTPCWLPASSTSLNTPWVMSNVTWRSEIFQCGWPDERFQMSTVFLGPAIRPALDEHYRPAVLANRAFRATARVLGKAVPMEVALERADGSVSRFAAELLPDDHPKAPQNFLFTERLLKFLL